MYYPFYITQKYPGNIHIVCTYLLSQSLWEQVTSPLQENTDMLQMTNKHARTHTHSKKLNKMFSCPDDINKVDLSIFRYSLCYISRLPNSLLKKSVRLSRSAVCLPSCPQSSEQNPLDILFTRLRLNS